MANSTNDLQPVSHPARIGAPVPILDAAWLRNLALNAGADDVGFVSLETRPHLSMCPSSRLHVAR